MAAAAARYRRGISELGRVGQFQFGQWELLSNRLPVQPKSSFLACLTISLRSSSDTLGYLDNRDLPRYRVPDRRAGPLKPPGRPLPTIKRILISR